MKYEIVVLDARDKDGYQPWSFFAAGQDNKELARHLKELSDYVIRYPIVDVKINKL